MDRMDEQQGSADSQKNLLTAEDFVALVLQHEHRIRGFVASLMLPSSEVDDVFQSACLAAFKKLESFSYKGDTIPDEEFVRWVCTIARYEVLQVYRKRRNAKVVFSSELVTEIADMQLRNTKLILDRTDALAECVEHLTERQRSLVTMRYRDGTPVADIATYLGKSANGIYKALERVRAQLMACIRRKLNQEGFAQ